LLEGQITHYLPDYTDVDTLLLSRTSESQRVVAQNIYRSWDASTFMRNVSKSISGEYRPRAIPSNVQPMVNVATDLVV
jgi:hypothetical protein